MASYGIRLYDELENKAKQIYAIAGIKKNATEVIEEIIDRALRYELNMDD